MEDLNDLANGIAKFFRKRKHSLSLAEKHALLKSLITVEAAAASDEEEENMVYEVGIRYSDGFHSICSYAKI